MAATANGLPNEPMPRFNDYSTRPLFIFKEDKRNVQFPTNHGVSDTPRVIFHQKSDKYTRPLSRNIPGTKAKMRYSEWISYSLNMLHSVAESSRLVFSKWKKSRVRVDSGWWISMIEDVNECLTCFRGSTFVKSIEYDKDWQTYVGGYDR